MGKILTILTLCVVSSYSLEYHIFSGYQYGEVAYKFDFPIPEFSTSDSSWYGKSELIYPIDGITIGSSLSWTLSQFKYTPQKLLVSFWTQITNPNRKMSDEDWIGLKTNNIGLEETFSYTKSSTEITHYGGNVNIDLREFHFLLNPLTLSLGVEWNYLYLEAQGIEGWQIDSTGNKVYIDQDIQNFYSNVVVLTYKTVYLSPYLEVNYFLTPPNEKANNTQWILSGQIGSSYVKDRDDHPLRNKETKASGFGVFFGGSSELRIPIRSRIQLLFRGSGEASFVKAKMEQYWYGDDPGTIEYETGTSLTVDNNYTRLIQFRLETGLIFEF
jgi:hypothetical protein